MNIEGEQQQCFKKRMKIILLRRKDSKSESRARLFVYLSNEAVELLLG